MKTWLRWVCQLALFGFAWGVAQGTPLTFVQDACTTADLVTPVGRVCGRLVEVEGNQAEGNQVEAYLGIPYAESTAGANRFEPPVPKAPWADTFRATAFGPICPQNKPPDQGVQGEDCLSLNVWRPVRASPTGPLPVLVNIHGGAFVEGSSAQPGYEGSNRPLRDGAYLAATQNLVVVSMNYRVGALGSLAGRAGRTGNYGLKDQQLALEWVRDNIAAFGGNPDLVTLSGESAGAQSVGLHLLSVPTSAPLFEAAIMQSNPFGIPFRTLEQAGSTAELYLLAVGCKFRFDQLGCLREKTTEELLAAQQSGSLSLTLLDYGLAAFLNWAPVVDGEFVTSQPITVAQQEGLSKPTLMGTNTNEGTVFFATPGAKPLGLFGYASFLRTLLGADNAAPIMSVYPRNPSGDNTDQAINISTDYLFTCGNRAVAQAAQAPLYLYQYTHVPSFSIWPDIPRCANESCHGDELAFVFHSAAGEMSFTPEEEQLSQQMANYWGRFASIFHNPNGVGQDEPVWPSFNRSSEYLQLDVPLEVKTLDDGVCSFWNALGYPVEQVDEPF